MTQVTVKTVAVERRETEKQMSVEEEVTKKEALERWNLAVLCFIIKGNIQIKKQVGWFYI